MRWRDKWRTPSTEGLERHELPETPDGFGEWLEFEDHERYEDGETPSALDDAEIVYYIMRDYKHTNEDRASSIAWCEYEGESVRWYCLDKTHHLYRPKPENVEEIEALAEMDEWGLY